MMFLLGNNNLTFVNYLFWQAPSRVNSPVYGVSKKELSHNERFNKDYENERRLKKKKVKLITATEVAIAHNKRMSTVQMKGKPNCYMTTVINSYTNNASYHSVVDSMFMLGTIRWSMTSKKQRN